MNEVNPATSARCLVIAVGETLGSADVQALGDLVAGAGGTIRATRRLSEAGPLAALELLVDLPAETGAVALRRAVLDGASGRAFDVGIQREALFRRRKRLVALDMDSTLIRVEVIDELARAHGVYEEVSRVTERAMRGELDFDASLRARVGLLAGMPFETVERIAAAAPLNRGAETLVRALRGLGIRIAVVSGGFEVAGRALQDRLGLHHVHANTLEVRDGRLTGRVVPPIVNAAGKAEILEAVASRAGIPLDRVVAVGDGANDRLMLQRAGLGIAFHAKPVLREAASISIDRCGLDAILYLLGYTARELAAFAGRAPSAG